MEDAPLKSIKNHLKGLLPERYVEFFTSKVGISDQTAVNRLSEANWAQIKSLTISALRSMAHCRLRRDL